MRTFLTLTILCFFSFSLSCFSQVLEVKTVTEALNYSGDRETVKKLIITDSIKGSDYSEGSEWREFRTLDTTFPNIEEVEILTDQDIPNTHYIKINDNDLDGYGLFYKYEYISGKLVEHSLYWLKYFSAPNVKYIGEFAFTYCENLKTINFPNAETIGIAAFGGGKSLTEVNFPEVKNIGNTCWAKSIALKSITFPKLEWADFGGWIGCINLESVSFGTDFKEQKEISFGHSVFGDSVNITEGLYDDPVATDKIKLTLGENVLPSPNLLTNTWQGTNSITGNSYPYIWKNITIETVGIEEEQPNKISDIFCIDKNIYYIADNISNLELYDITGRKIKDFNNTNIIDLNNFNIGVYFFKYIKESKIKTEKIIVN